MTAAARLWLYIYDPSGMTQHLVFLPECTRHTLIPKCACRPQIKNGIFVHAIITASYVPPQRREREH